jgi:integrase
LTARPAAANLHLAVDDDRLRRKSSAWMSYPPAGIEREDAHGRSLDLHALRHTAASRFARHGAPLAVTQRILGHSDPKLTARVYVHLGVEEMRGVVESARGA